MNRTQLNHKAYEDLCTHILVGIYAYQNKTDKQGFKQSLIKKSLPPNINKKDIEYSINYLLSSGYIKKDKEKRLTTNSERDKYISDLNTVYWLCSYPLKVSIRNKKGL